MTRTRWKVPVCFVLLLSLWFYPGSNLTAQKQSPPKSQRSRKPAAPVPVPKPRVKAPERPAVEITPQPPLADLQSPVTETRLQNGLKVLLQERHANPLVSVGCWYRVGSKDDPAGSAGLSNLARLSSLGEMNGYSSEQTSRLMRETGGDWQSMTLPDQTGFFETVHVSALEEVLKLEAARMSSVIVADPQFLRYRRRAVAQVQAREDQSMELLNDEVAATAFKRHPYRWPSLGWMPDVERISRDEVARYSRERFVPNNAVLVLVGDFETRTTLALVEKHFAAVPRRADPQRSEIVEPERRGERRVKVSEGKIPYLQIAFPTPELYNDDFYAMLVVDAVLTGAQGMRHWSNPQPAVAKESSRLFQALVDTGLAVEVRSRMSPRQAPGLYQLTLILTDVFQFQAGEEAVLEQLERLKNQELSEVELAKAKNLLVAGEFMAQDSVSKRAFQLGYFETTASHTLLNEFESKISRISKEDVRRVAIHYLAETSRTGGSAIPAFNRKTIEVEPLSPSGSESLSSSLLAPQAPVAPKELNARPPSLQPLLNPESVFDLKTSPVGVPQGKPRSEPRVFAEIPVLRLKPPKVQRKVLQNGVALIAAGNPGGSTITIRASLRTMDGDREAESGLAALTNAILRRGVSARSQMPFSAVFDYLGAEISSETDSRMSTITVRGLSKDAPTFLRLLAEMFQSSSLDASEFEKARQELLGRLFELEADVSWAAERALRQRFYPVGQNSPVPGTARSAESVRLEDVRDFYKRCYRPPRLILSIAGDVSPEDVLTAGEQAFGSWKEAGSAPSPAAKTMPRVRSAEPLDLRTKRSGLVLTGIGTPSPVQPDYYPFLILRQILAGGPGGGRLGDRVLDGDTAIYGIEGRTSDGIPEQLFSLRLMAAPSDVERAVALMREELGRLREQGVTEEEVKRAKRSLIHAWAVRMGSNDELARTLQNMESQGLAPDYLETYASFIEAVSRESVLDCARVRLDFERTPVVVVGPTAAN